MVELQEPSDLMVVAERFTPSGRRIPDAKMHGGVGWEMMFDVYEYEGRTFEETCAKYVSKSAEGACDCICGPGLTDKFSMWRIVGGGSVEIPRSAGVAVVTGSRGEVNGLAVRKGDRLLLTGERHVTASVGTDLVLCV